MTAERTVPCPTCVAMLIVEPLHGVQIAVEVFPVDLECTFTAPSQSFAKLIARRAVERGAETHPAVSEVFESHALGEFRIGVRIDKK